MAMKRSFFSCMVLVVSLLASWVLVQGAEETSPSSVVKVVSWAEVNLIFDHFNYKEDVPAPLKSTENGLLPGLGLALVRLEKGPSLFARLAGEYNTAHTNYDGTTQSGIPVTGGTKNKFFNAEGNIGLTLPAPSATHFTVYTGLGYHYWERGLGGEALYGTVPYREHYTWKYVPAGLRWDSRPKGQWGFGVDFASLFMFGGMIRVYFTDIYPTLNDLDLTLGNRPGWKLQTPVRYRYLTFIPWVASSAIGQSNTDTLRFRGEPIAVGYEPSSMARHYGLNVGARLVLP
jgi:hypothetical protein